MFRPRRLAIALLVVWVVVMLAAFRLSPLWPGPGLPAGATRLHIATEGPHLVPNLGCETALLLPGRVTTTRDDLVLVSTATDEPIQVVWPSGWAAWRIDGRAVLVSRDGAVVGREGDVLEGFGGGVGTDDAFHVCLIGG